jgi:copper resistance protein D
MLAVAVASAAFHGSALVAVGSLAFQRAFPELPAAGRASLRRQWRVAAWLGIALVLLQWPLQAAFLGGGAVAGAFDPFLLGLVFDSPQGSRILLAVLGLLLLQAGLLERGRGATIGPALALLGAVLVLLAFVQVGHTREAPRVLLAGLLLLHLGAIAFWLAALAPLHALATGSGDARAAAQVLVRFGRMAAGVVALLVLAGGVLAAWLLGGLQPLLTTPYGQVLLLKLALVSLLLGFAAGNKWRLVPSFERGDPSAPARLRWSIRIEIVLVVGVLLLTALLTSVSPPGR